MHLRTFFWLPSLLLVGFFLTTYGCGLPQTGGANEAVEVQAEANTTKERQEEPTSLEPQEEAPVLDEVVVQDASEPHEEPLQVENPPEGCQPGEIRACVPSSLPEPVQGSCKPGKQVCQSERTWGACTGAVFPTQETCNGKDDDCDGWVDNVPLCVYTLAGTGQKGYKEGPGAQAQFDAPSGLVVTSKGIVFIADTINQRIRMIDRLGVVSTYAGTGDPGSKDGFRTEAQFFNPGAIALGPNDSLYIADTVNHTIRKIDPQGNVTTLAGSQLGLRNGKGSAARFYFPSSLAVSPKGVVFVADTLNHAIRKVTPDGTVTTMAGNGDPGWKNGTGAVARFNMPIGIAMGFQGSLLIADSVNNMIRRLELNGTVTTVAGEGNRGFRDGIATYARFYQPPGVTTDSKGNIYVADAANQRIRKIAPDGTVTTLAGNGRQGSKDGLTSQAELFGPTGIFMGPQNRLYFTDFNSHTIRVLQLPD
ncbi:MAG: hypothetical protein EP343_19265 [Deltaproteobacteria bacterium]|nr:MAG: hypothetical protein EP343_19265 [Deltaproteobacteria bacterium]